MLLLEEEGGGGGGWREGDGGQKIRIAGPINGA